MGLPPGRVATQATVPSPNVSTAPATPWTDSNAARAAVTALLDSGEAAGALAFRPTSAACPASRRAVEATIELFGDDAQSPFRQGGEDLAQERAGVHQGIDRLRSPTSRRQRRAARVTIGSDSSRVKRGGHAVDQLMRLVDDDRPMLGQHGRVALHMDRQHARGW